MTITAFHGSSAKFDTFNEAYLNTGNELMKYGSGFYFTDDPVGANFWRKQALRGDQEGCVYVVKIPDISHFLNGEGGIDDQPISMRDLAEQWYEEKGIDLDSLYDDLYNAACEQSMGFSETQFDELYEKVLLSDLPYMSDLMDYAPEEHWDALIQAIGEVKLYLDYESGTGQQLYQDIARYLGDEQKAQQWLSQNADIKGIVFTNPNAGEYQSPPDSKMYLVWSAKDIQILKCYEENHERINKLSNLRHEKSKDYDEYGF